MQQKLIDEQWVDIVQPGVAPGSDLSGWLIGIAFGVMIGAGIYFLYYRQPRQQLRRFIHALQIRMSSSHDYKFALSQLEHRLCNYLGLATLAQRDRLSPDWQVLLESVVAHRYRKHQPSAEQTREVLQRCLQLLSTNRPVHVG